MNERIIFFDSDGTVMDSMSLKHEKALGPALIEVFKLQQIKDDILQKWYNENLYKPTRGLNRFDSLLSILEYVDLKFSRVSYLDDYRVWLESTDVKSVPSLYKYIKSHNVPEMQKICDWADLVNQKIEVVKEQIVPFKEVEKCIKEVAKNFKIIIVSTANKKALECEWRKFDFLKYVSEVCSQEVGTKDYCIRMMLEKYKTKNAVMIGDSIVDLNAAKNNGIPYYPIIPKHENESWVEFLNIYLPMILDGSYKDCSSILEKRFVSALENNISK